MICLLHWCYEMFALSFLHEVQNKLCYVVISKTDLMCKFSRSVRNWRSRVAMNLLRFQVIISR